MIQDMIADTVRVAFRNIRMDRHIPALQVHAKGEHDLASAIRAHVRPYMDYGTFEVQFGECGGWIDAGTYNAGNFTIKPAAVES